MNENEISKIIVDAAIEVHRELGGPGLIEDLYEEELAEELRLRGILVIRLNAKARRKDGQGKGQSLGRKGWPALSVRAL